MQARVHHTWSERSCDLRVDKVAGDLRSEVVVFGTAPYEWETIVLERTCSDRAQQSQRPLLVIPHGGPHANFTTTFTHTFAAYAALGYVVLLVNYRGSSAYGRAALESLPGLSVYARARVCVCVSGSVDVDMCAFESP